MGWKRFGVLSFLCYRKSGQNGILVKRRLRKFLFQNTYFNLMHFIPYSTARRSVEKNIVYVSGLCVLYARVRVQGGSGGGGATCA